MNNMTTFDEAIRLGIIKEGDLINPYELYSKTTDQVCFRKKYTGTHIVKVFSREDNMKCFYGKDFKGIPTLWFDTTKESLILSGKNGFLRGIECINKICNLFSNIEVGMIARSITTQDMDYLSVTPETKQRLREFGGCFWLGNSYVSNKKSKHITFGIMNAACVHYAHCELYCTDGTEFLNQCGVRAAVSMYMPETIWVDLCSKDKDGAWRLFLKK